MILTTIYCFSLLGATAIVAGASSSSAVAQRGNSRGTRQRGGWTNPRGGWKPPHVNGPAERRTSAFIRRSRDLGFTLEEIRALLDSGEPERASCADVHKIASTHLNSVRNKLSDLIKLEIFLAKAVARCSATPDCPVLDILDAGRKIRSQPAQDRCLRTNRASQIMSVDRGKAEVAFLTQLRHQLTASHVAAAKLNSALPVMDLEKTGWISFKREFTLP